MYYLGALGSGTNNPHTKEGFFIYDVIMTWAKIHSKELILQLSWIVFFWTINTDPNVDVIAPFVGNWCYLTVLG